ncbi:putative ribonuclease H-like domain-containing protein [Tanacetum coccineum]
MRMEQYLQCIDYTLWEIIENGNAPIVTKTVDGKEIVIPLTSVEEKAQRRAELKARSTLLMDLPNEHQLKFNSYKDAKTLIQDIENRFGEVIDQTYERLQKLISQLEMHGKVIPQEDINQKFLRSLSQEWTMHTIVWRNKPEIKTLSLDDLFNNLKAYESEGAADSSTTVENLSDGVIYSFFASQPSTPQLDNEDLQQINPDDLEEMDLRIDQGVGSSSGIRACALRNFDLEVMELENTQNNALAKLPMLKLREYEMWEIRIKQKMCKKNDVKASSLLLHGTATDEHTTFLDQYVDAQSMFATIKARFGGNEATKKTQKALLKQQYENFSASSLESLDSIFNRLQRLVSRLAILGMVTPPEDLNVKCLKSLPSEWDTHVVVWINKPDFDTMSLDDLYNNFKIIEQKVKKSVGARNDDKNLAFVTTSGVSSTNNINTVNPEVSIATTKVNTASTEICTASFSDATVYAFLSTQPKGSQLVHEDLEQLHDDDLEEMDLKWNMALLSMRARKFYQRTGRKIIIDGSNTAGYDKSKVECFNCHKMGHFARECRAPRSKDNRNWNQGSSSKAVKIEDASKKAMCAIDALKKQYNDLLVKLDDTSFKVATYKRGLATLEDQIVKYREHEVLFSKEIALLKRSVGHKEYQMGLLRAELEKVKQENEGFGFKIAKFHKSTKDLEQLLASQITDKSKKGFGYNVVPSPHPLIPLQCFK